MNSNLGSMSSSDFLTQLSRWYQDFDDSGDWDSSSSKEAFNKFSPLQTLCKGSLRPVWCWMFQNIATTNKIQNIKDNLFLAEPETQEKVLRYKNLRTEHEQLLEMERTLKTEIEELETQNQDCLTRITYSEAALCQDEELACETAIRTAFYAAADAQWRQKAQGWEAKVEAVTQEMSEAWEEKETIAYMDTSIQRVFEELTSKAHLPKEYTTAANKTSEAGSAQSTGALKEPRLKGSVVMDALAQKVKKSCFKLQMGVHPATQEAAQSKAEEEMSLKICQIIGDKKAKTQLDTQAILPRIQELLYKQKLAQVQRFEEAQQLRIEADKVMSSVSGYQDANSPLQTELALQLVAEQASLETLKNASKKLQESIIEFQKERKILESRVTLLGILDELASEKDLLITGLAVKNKTIYQDIKTKRTEICRKYDDQIVRVVDEIKQLTKQVQKEVEAEAASAAKVKLERLLRSHTARIPIESDDGSTCELKVAHPDLAIVRAAQPNSQMVAVAQALEGSQLYSGSCFPSFERIIETAATLRSSECAGELLSSETSFNDKLDGPAVQVLQKAQNFCEQLQVQSREKNESEELDNLLQKLSICGEQDLAEFNQDVEDWWSQPGQFVADWIQKNGKPISHYISEARKRSKMTSKALYDHC